MHIQGKVGMRAHPFQGFLQEQTVGAQIDMLSPQQNSLDKFVHVRIQKRLPAGNCYNRGRALIHGSQTFFKCHHLLQGIGIFTDPAAARAGQIAQMSRLKHQHEREFIVPHHFVLDDVTGKIKVQFQRETHYGLFLSIILLFADPVLFRSLMR
jgi:hypothetical protein